MEILFLTEAKKKVGYGHLIRCLSLYNMFKQKGNNVKLIIDGDEHIINLISETNNQTLDWANKLEKIIPQIKNYDLIIIDSYLTKKKTYLKIQENARLCAYFDDSNRIEYPPGIIINGGASTNEIKYLNHPNTLLGLEYFPLRSEFKTRQNKKINHHIKNILITFGSDDIRNLTPRIIHFLQQKYPSYKLKVLIGSAFQNKKEIELSSTTKTTLFQSLTGEKIKELMENVDLAITGGGQTIFELANVGIPSIVIQIAENQKNNIIGLNKKGTLMFAGNYDDPLLLDNINKNVELLKSKGKREEMSKKAMQTIDGNGSERIVNYLLDLMKK